MKNKHTNIRYYIGSAVVVALIVGCVFVYMYATKTVLFSTPAAPAASNQSPAAPTSPGVDAVYKSTIPSITNQADQDYQEAQNALTK